MIAFRKIAALAAIILLVMASMASADALIRHESSSLTGTGSVLNIDCDATVTRALDGIFTYTYVLNYTSGTSAVHTYKVQNPNYAYYFGAANIPVDGNKFDNPADGNASWVTWINGALPIGTTRTFSYQSYYSPQEIEVWTYAIDGGGSAKGKTLGIGDVIPEPSSLTAIMFGIAGLGMVVRRRK